APLEELLVRLSARGLRLEPEPERRVVVQPLLAAERRGGVGLDPVLAREAVVTRLVAVPLPGLVPAPRGRDGDDCEQDRLYDLDQLRTAFRMVPTVTVSDSMRDLVCRDRLGHREKRSHTRRELVHPKRTMRGFRSSERLAQ